jgi:NAD(P)H-dependent flavin oxidoreductase YrpB (nitropropane dioxygenase family)
VGTAFLATPEAVEVSDEHKRRVVHSDGEDTVYTEVFDIVEEKVFGIKWPEGIASRASSKAVLLSTTRWLYVDSQRHTFWTSCLGRSPMPRGATFWRGQWTPTCP